MLQLRKTCAPSLQSYPKLSSWFPVNQGLYHPEQELEHEEQDVGKQKENYPVTDAAGSPQQPHWQVSPPGPFISSKNPVSHSAEIQHAGTFDTSMESAAIDPTPTPRLERRNESSTAEI